MHEEAEMLPLPSIISRASSHESSRDRSGSVQTAYGNTGSPDGMGFWRRSSPLLVIFLSTLLSLVPSVLLWRGHTFDASTRMYYFTTHERNTVQVILVVMTSLFGLLWTWSVTSVYNMAMRSFLAGRPESLSTLRLHISISKAAFDMNLPLRLQIISAFFCGIALVPQLMWTGALTPGIFSGIRSGEVIRASTGNGSYPFLHHLVNVPLQVDCLRSNQLNGTFTNCPGTLYTGNILDSLATASISRTGQTRNHSKFDNSGFAYANRSYGVGAGVGLVPLPDYGIIEAYNFTEIGYLTTANCIYNQSANWTLKVDEVPVRKNGGGVPSVYGVGGLKPNEYSGDVRPYGYDLVDLDNTQPRDIVALSSSGCCNYTNGTSPFFVAMAAGFYYSFLDQIQCEIFFEPRTFAVNVSMSTSTIQVIPQDDPATVEDPEPSGQLREWALRGIQAISMVETTLYWSSIGEALARGVVLAQNFTSFDKTKPLQEAVLPALNDSIEAALDDILAATGGFALTQNGTFNSEAATFRISVVAIGTKPYIIGLLVLNLVALLGICAVSAYTRMFDRSSAFDFADLGAMVAGAKNSTALSGQESYEWSLRGWKGNPTDPILYRMFLRVDCEVGASEPPSVSIVGDGGSQSRKYRGLSGGS